MKAFPFKMVGNAVHGCSPEEAECVSLHCPGPFPNLMIPVMLKGKRAGTGKWSWNGDVEKPTLKPSLRTQGKRPLTDDERARMLAGEILDIPDIVSHCWINAGQIIFLPDSQHELAGSTHDLLDIDREFWSNE